MKKLLLALTLLTSITSFAGEVCVVSFSKYGSYSECTDKIANKEISSNLKELSDANASSQDIQAAITKTRLDLIKHLIDNNYKYQNENLYIKY